MENCETYLQLKLTSVSPKTLRNIFVVVIGISIVLIFVFTWNSCSFKYISILNDIDHYEETLDPEFCETTVYRIDAFNDECEPEIEIIDCG